MGYYVDVDTSLRLVSKNMAQGLKQPLLLQSDEETFGNTVLQHNSWCSQRRFKVKTTDTDLNPCDFLLWRYLKGRTTENLKETKRRLQTPWKLCCHFNMSSHRQDKLSMFHIKDCINEVRTDSFNLLTKWNGATYNINL
jgi:hypothetical protein